MKISPEEMTRINDHVKLKFQSLIDSGIIKANIKGPKQNVLNCATIADWCIATGELCKSGFNCTSPGGFGGSHPLSRQNTWNKVWREGTLCAAVIEKKILIFSLSQTINDYCHIVENKNI